MSANPFCHLHVLSAFSLPDGACRIEDLARRAARFDPPAVAITDEGTLYAVTEFYETARREGVRPIFGCRLRLTDAAADAPAGTLTLLAENLRGYRNLLRLSTWAQLHGAAHAPAALPLEILDRHRSGLIALSGGPDGPLDRALRADRPDVARELGGRLAELFGGGFFLELQNQGLPRQAETNAALRALAVRLNLSTVATNGVRYLLPSDAAAQRWLRRIRTGDLAGEPFPAEPMGRHDLADAEEMARRFPDDAEALRRTAEIAFRCTVELPLRSPTRFPRFPLPEEFDRPDRTPAESAFANLRAQADAGLARRYGADATTANTAAARRLRERCAAELETIRQAGFVNYFLVVADYVAFARHEGIEVGPGRGSGVGSLVAYALGITEVDPMRFGLSFERFLNPERSTPPDLDVDFCPDRRGEVIAYLRRKYGEDRTAQVIAFNTFSARSALRDAARAFGIPADRVERWARSLPDEARAPGHTAWRSRLATEAIEASDSEARRVFNLARALAGLPRNIGTHAAGVVLSNAPLVEIVPLQRDREGAVITQFDMAALAAAGMVKVDILGLRTLGALREAAAAARGAGRAAPAGPEIPLDDPATLALLNRADTIGVFQLESAGMRDLLRRLGIGRFEDLVAAIALHRPATLPILDEFVARKHGRAPVVFDHPALRPILAETHGLVLYQEQVQQAAEALAGFTPAQGDRLRRAIAEGDDVEMETLSVAFREGCRRRRRIAAEVADALFERLRRHAGYGFNKAHGVAYALLAWRAAWWKAHDPAAFLCGQMSSEIGNPERVAALLAEAHRLGIETLGPDLNRSGERFALEGGRLRYGLAAIKFVGVEAAQAIVVERAENGPYRGLRDLCLRVPSHRLPRRALESLVRSGALDFTGVSRRRLFAGLDLALAAARHAAETAGQAILPGMGSAMAERDDRTLPDLEPWSESERLAAERELLGFHTSGHPLSRYEWMFPLLGLNAFARDAAPRPGDRIRCAGTVAGPRRRADGGGELRLETAERIVPVTAAPDVWPEIGARIAEGAAVWIEGIVTAAEGKPGLSARRIERLDSAPERLARRVILELPPAGEGEARMAALREALARHAGPTPVELQLCLPSGERVDLHAGPACAVSLSAPLVRAVEGVLGKGALHVEVNPIGE